MAHPTPSLMRKPWVYVGNFYPNVTDEQLRDYFAACGTVREAEICYTGSLAAGTGDPGFRHAIVKFGAARSSTAALRLDGRRVPGIADAIMVRATIGELPYVKEQMDHHEAGVAPLPARVQTASGLQSARNRSQATQVTQVWNPPAHTQDSDEASDGKDTDTPVASSSKKVAAISSKTGAKNAGKGGKSAEKVVRNGVSFKLTLM
ncbi:hypothetical protein FB451DRAFT_1491427 [Mycena latifolia]|nr:hypothetical protein FB451DRAFT_1491427 [Mycena latifolia]